MVCSSSVRAGPPMLFSGRLQGAGCKHNYKHGVMAVLPTILMIENQVLIMGVIGK